MIDSVINTRVGPDYQRPADRTMAVRPVCSDIP